MKNITFIFLFLGTIGFAQNLGNPATIGQSNRNQKVGKGLQITDSLITDGVVVFKNLVTYGSGVDTGVGFKNGKIVRFLNTAGGGSGGSSALFPNGAEVITTSGEYQSSYAGKLLVLGAGVELTMPLVNPLPTCNVGVVSFVEESEGRGKFNLQNGAGLIKPAVDEVVILLSFAGNNTLGLTSPLDETGTGTMSKYLYENLGFRGTATLSSGTVTVTTDKVKTGYKIYVSVNTPSGTQGFLSAPTGSIVDATEFVINSSSALDNSTVNWWITP